MGLYDSSIQANQQGLDAIAQSHQLGLQQPTKVGSFLQGLKDAQQMHIARMQAQGLLNYRQGLIGTKEEANQIRAQKSADDAINVYSKMLPIAKDPTLAAKMAKAVRPELSDSIDSLASAYTTDQGTGTGYQQKQDMNDASIGLKEAQGNQANSGATFTAGPKTDLTVAQTGLTNNNATLKGIDANTEDSLRQSMITRNNRPPVSNSFNVELPQPIVQNMAADAAKNPALINLLTGRNMKARAQITNELYGNGENPDLAGTGAQYKTNESALNKVQTMASTLGAFEKTTLRNMDEFKNAAKRIEDTGVPILNTPLRAFNRDVLGSKDQAIFDAWRNVHLPELARVIQSANATGVNTVHAQNMIEQMNAGNATIGQILATTEELRKAVGYRVEELNKEADTLRAKTSSRNQGGPQSSSISGTHSVTKDGKTYYLWSDGNYHTKAPE